MLRLLLPQGKGVQRSPQGQQHAAANGQGKEQRQGVHIGAAGKGTQGPERNGLDLFTGKGDQQVHQAGDKHRKYHADEDNRARGQAAVQGIGQGQNQGQGTEGEKHGHDHGARKGQARELHPQHNGQHSPQGSPGGNPQGGTIRQGVAQQSLHGRPTQGKGSPRQRHAEHPGQPHPQDNSLPRTAGLRPRKTSPQDLQGLPGRERHAPGTHAQQHGHQQHRGQAPPKKFSPHGSYLPTQASK